MLLLLSRVYFFLALEREWYHARAYPNLPIPPL